MRTCLVVLVVALLAFGSGVSSSFAQTRPPDTYSITLVAGNTILKADRDGSKESLEQTVPPGPNGPGMHVRQIYDFATHKYWTMDLEGGPCVLGTYTSTYLPSMFDPVGAVAETKAGLAEAKAVALRSEAVSGIATKVYEMPVPEIKGKMRVFLDETHNFAVQMVTIQADGKEQVVMELKSLSYARPAASLFVPPQNCRVQAGESSATGGHAEMSFEASQKAEVDLSKQKPQRAGAAAQASGPASRAQAAAAGAITEVRAVAVDPAHYTGPAPAVYNFTFAVTASGPVKAKYVLVNQADIAWAWGDINFTAAGTKEIKVPVKVGVSNGAHWEGSAKLEVVVGATRTASVPLKVSSDAKMK